MESSMAIQVGIVGVSGYTGIELLRLVHAHPELELSYVAAKRAAGELLTTVWPGLSGIPELDGKIVEALDPHKAASCCDVVFLALPHGVAAQVAPALVDSGLTVVDLGADFRLQDPASYQRYYGLEHPCPDRLADAVYGLVEINREQLKGAKLIANPGCYPTATALAVYPLLKAGYIDDWIVADCLSGVSGAGRNPGIRNLYCEVADSAGPYGIGGAHRHVPEIEQILGCKVTFTPHLVPMIRGMIATVHVRCAAAVKADDLRALYQEHYANDPMVVVRGDVPNSSDVRGSNRAHVHVTVDPERDVITAVCALVNLLKGASGQALQALNVSLGLDEVAGLPMLPLIP
jgi:N-acetyl-gamma-glutamyl-phosphate reductase